MASVLIDLFFKGQKIMFFMYICAVFLRILIMKKIILSFVALFSAMVCFSQSCTIIGRMNVSDFQNKEVSILNAATFDVLATTKIVDSAFTFDISVDEPFWGWIKTETLSGNNYYFLDVVVEPGTVTCDLVTDDLAGTSTNDRYFKFITVR